MLFLEGCGENISEGVLLLQLLHERTIGEAKHRADLQSASACDSTYPTRTWGYSDVSPTATARCGKRGDRDK